MFDLYWAKVKEEAVLPKKRQEDAGYDLFACFDQDFVEIASLQTALIPLGVASAFEQSAVMLLKERGSSGKAGLSLRAGVVDSGYRGEYIACITNVNAKPIRIIKKQAMEKQSQQELETYLYYPYEKALCQGVLVQIPAHESKTISYQELWDIPSLRRDGKLGSSGK